jgi:uncharacterized protein
MVRVKAIVKPILIFLGTIFLILAIIGIALPLLPTTPLLLLAAICYAKSSERLYQWLLNTRWLGSYIKSFQAGEGIPLKSKIIAIIVLWVTSSYSIFFLVPIIWVKFLLFVVVFFITYYLFSIKTKVEKANEKKEG